MSAFELNKWAGAILATALLIMVINILGNSLFADHHDHMPPVYLVETLEPVAVIPPSEVSRVPIALLLLAADPKSGEKTAKKCVACHTLSADGEDKIGPNLWSIIGRDKGARSDFRYSTNLANAEGEWGYEELDLFLTSPKSYIPGTKMVFPGIKKRETRANLISYLRNLADTPAPLPTD